MAYEHKPGSGSIFKNEHKTSENHPEYRGSVITPDGKKWDVSLWVKKSQGGKSYFSVALKEPYVKPEDRSDNLEAIERSSAQETKQYAEEQGIIDNLPF